MGASTGKALPFLPNRNSTKTRKNEKGQRKEDLMLRHSNTADRMALPKAARHRGSRQPFNQPCRGHFSKQKSTAMNIIQISLQLETVAITGIVICKLSCLDVALQKENQLSETEEIRSLPKFAYFLKRMNTTICGKTLCDEHGQQTNQDLRNARTLSSNAEMGWWSASIGWTTITSCIAIPDNTVTNVRYSFRGVEISKVIVDVAFLSCGDQYGNSKDVKKEKNLFQREQGQTTADLILAEFCSQLIYAEEN
ncbi:hypothetical protein OUZ56_003931 [Daphnia magna]|uniref:Uncharacterized protein n=1 Tax=Daphnia magna TaxID=35525 RepID=A0ABQ9YN85_9CRUS|nr:hypothetical protein OUZ56_003931 [Daphnia magna]